MLASSSSSLSATFWSAAAVIVAFATILVTVVLWRLGSPRRLLLYSLESDTALLSSDARARAAGAQLRMILGGQELSDPHFVSLQIGSYSRSDIRPGDFTDGRALAFDLATPILKVLACHTGGDKMPEVRIGTDSSRVLVGPSLINRRQMISLDLLADGPVTLTCPRPPLADVKIRERSDETRTPEPNWLKPASYIAGLTGIVGLILVRVGQLNHIAQLRNIGTGIFIGVFFGLPIFAAATLSIMMIRNRRLPKNRRPAVRHK